MKRNQCNTTHQQNEGGNDHFNWKKKAFDKIQLFHDTSYWLYSINKKKIRKVPKHSNGQLWKSYVYELFLITSPWLGGYCLENLTLRSLVGVIAALYCYRPSCVKHVSPSFQGSCELPVPPRLGLARRLSSLSLRHSQPCAPGGYWTVFFRLLSSVQTHDGITSWGS